VILSESDVSLAVFVDFAATVLACLYCTDIPEDSQKVFPVLRSDSSSSCIRSWRSWFTFRAVGFYCGIFLFTIIYGVSSPVITVRSH
jgi:hypothetical protein